MRLWHLFPTIGTADFFHAQPVRASLESHPALPAHWLSPQKSHSGRELVRQSTLPPKDGPPVHRGRGLIPSAGNSRGTTRALVRVSHRRSADRMVWPRQDRKSVV